MSTQINYNGIELGFIRTLQISQDAVYDPSDSDYLYTKINIRVSSLLNRDIVPPSLGSETPTQTMNRIRKSLLTQCATLEFIVANETLFSSPALGLKEDVKHGPKPIYCNIMRIDGASTFHIEYCIETYIYDENCTDSHNAYISNRWKENQSVDEHGYTKRTISGKAIFRGNFIDGKKLSLEKESPDSYRGFLIPPNVAIPQGFKRMSMDFTVPEDGLGLEYTIVDEEQYTNPPDPLTKFEAEYTATSSKGAVWNDQVVARGWGNALQPKAGILLTLVNLALQTFDSQILIQASGATVWNSRFSYRLHENYVEISISRMLSGSTKTFQSLNGEALSKLQDMDYFGSGRKVKDSTGASLGVRGTSNLGMLAFDSYLNQCILPSTQQMRAPTGV